MSEPCPILHVDMDAFYASIEQRDNPDLRGKPVLVGGAGRRGVVSAASYESRKFGCRSAQPMAVALRMCPQAIVVPVRFRHYQEVSRQIFGIFDRYTPLVESLSVDEAFLDLTGTEKLHGPSVQVAQRIRAAIKAETQLTASVGVAPNKFLAKLASDLNKPDGMTVIPPEKVLEILSPLAIGKMWGIGPKTATKLEAMGVRTIGHLQRMTMDWLSLHFGEDAERYWRLSRGIDSRSVTPDRAAKSIGQEQTFGENLTDPDAVRQVLLEEVEEVAARLRRHGLTARAVTVKIRFGDFKTITRRCTLPESDDLTSTLWHAARSLFDAWAKEAFQPVRLIGVQAGQLEEGQEQLSLFENPSSQKLKKVDQAVDQINKKFGSGKLKRGGV